MRKTKSHKWIFTSRFRTNAYSWKASRLACKRIKEAVSEIKKADQVKADIVKIVSADNSTGMFVRDILGPCLDIRNNQVYFHEDQR
ncbi:hypothetical protein D1BOALGB6SA_549 [Olavius sp. associated proteobacterium Delta 1]|nr:hypothetical protein D1BOALGB6SA_549 [Olavius sp. associated proteobacterium Delta 1]